MMEEGNNDQYRDEIYANRVRAGKRTYFFDVKSTKGNDLYLTITESKKRFNKDEGKPFYEKHKIFLYKEDFDKFIDGLQDAIDKIKELRSEYEVYAQKFREDLAKQEAAQQQDNEAQGYGEENPNSSTQEDDGSSSQYTDVNFEDLGGSSSSDDDRA